MKKEIREEFWHAFEDSPFIMIRLDGKGGHAEPLTAQLDRSAHHEFWFFVARSNRIASGGPAEAQFSSKGHDVFASLSGNLVEETDRAIREKHWGKQEEAWFPNGLADPNVLMLRYDISEAEVWTADVSVGGKLKMLVGAQVNPSDAGAHAVGQV